MHCFVKDTSHKNPYAKILLVNNSTLIQQQIGSLLKPKNYQLAIAQNAQEAEKKLIENSFELIILDLELPDKNGEDVLRFMKKNSNTKETPTLILTKSYDSTLVSRLIKQGANEFFLKPFIPEELLLKIDFWIDFQRKTKATILQKKILQEYKDAVDRSSIVSKTDKHGNIIFINEQFCKISGYSEGELLGKPHSIVRHPDMPKKAFQDMWTTILEGNPWRGIVKNQRKDGSAYWVDAVINPIIDSNGDIIEFIGIRQDITEIQLVREKLKNDLKISNTNFEEAYQRAGEYEKAINESTILTRTDLDGNIIFANEYFYKTTGFSQEDVIGVNHNIIKHEETPKEVFIELWDTITSGKIWKGVFKNKKKDGSPYWVYSTILPIFDKDKNIVEYMAIRNEITKVIALNEEIEDTQKELIFRMGELAESRSKETGSHVKRVSEYAKLLALELGYEEKEANLIAMASPMHDIGKVAIPDFILTKPGAFNNEEWEMMKTHSLIGYNVLKSSERPLLRAASIIAKEHHEKYNGKGYPDGLKEEEIHPYARIVAIADVFDALSFERIYKAAWSDKEIKEFFELEKGEHFDPTFTECFLNNFEKFIFIRNNSIK